MIGLDTNILVRFLVQDDPAQAAAARSLMTRCSAQAPGFVGREVLVETVWVLERAYRLTPAAISAAILGLLEAEELVIEQAIEDRKSTRLNSSHVKRSRMPSSA